MILVARRLELLEQVANRINEAGGRALVNRVFLYMQKNFYFSRLIGHDVSLSLRGALVYQIRSFFEQKAVDPSPPPSF